MKTVLCSILSLCLIMSANLVTAQEMPHGFVPASPIQIEVLNTYPHDTTAFTQGLLWHSGSLYESTGDPDRSGASTLREVNPITGEVIRSIPVKRDEPLSAGRSEYFAEGLELVGNQLIQLTWKAETAFIYDRETFEEIDRITYAGEGWGICSDGRYYYMSDGSQYLSIRKLDTFELVAKMLVTINGQPLQRQLLNELECVDDSIYANLWRTTFIVEIDKFTGNIIGLIDATDLLTDEQIVEIPGSTVADDGTIYPSSSGVLNGIAYNPENDTFFITGKHWPWVFEVNFVAVEAEN